MAQNYKERPIIILIDEIIFPDEMLKNLSEHSESFPANVRIIAVVNPRFSSDIPTLPKSVLQINLTTPYRSTIAITSLARFLVKRSGLVVPEREFGSDVEGKKPIVFDVGADEDKLKTALQRSQELLGDDATLLYDGYFPPSSMTEILYDGWLPSSMKEICESHGKKKGGPWECYNVLSFYGWEAERVVVVTNGDHIMELITRGRTHLAIILVDGGRNNQYAQFKKHFQQAECLGLVDVPLSDKENN